MLQLKQGSEIFIHCSTFSGDQEAQEGLTSHKILKWCRASFGVQAGELMWCPEWTQVNDLRRPRSLISGFPSFTWWIHLEKSPQKSIGAFSKMDSFRGCGGVFFKIRSLWLIQSVEAHFASTLTFDLWLLTGGFQFYHIFNPVPLFLLHFWFPCALHCAHTRMTYIGVFECAGQSWKMHDGGHWTRSTNGILSFIYSHLV